MRLGGCWLADLSVICGGRTTTRQSPSHNQTHSPNHSRDLSLPVSQSQLPPPAGKGFQLPRYPRYLTPRYPAGTSHRTSLASKSKSQPPIPLQLHDVLSLFLKFSSRTKFQKVSPSPPSAAAITILPASAHGLKTQDLKQEKLSF